MDRIFSALLLSLLLLLQSYGVCGAPPQPRGKRGAQRWDARCPSSVPLPPACFWTGRRRRKKKYPTSVREAKELSQMFSQGSGAWRCVHICLLLCVRAAVGGLYGKGGIRSPGFRCSTSLGSLLSASLPSYALSYWWHSNSHPHGKRSHCVLVEKERIGQSGRCPLPQQLHTDPPGARGKFSVSVSQTTNLVVLFMDISQGICFHLSEKLIASLDFTLRTNYSIYIIIWNRFVGPKAHI